MGQPSDGTVPGNSTSRRTFLKGVVLAGAAGLAAPLLTSTSARAATVPVILGVNAPGPWLPQAQQPPGTKPWPTAVPGAPGCRSYRDDVLSTAAEIQDLIQNQGGFPGEPGSKPLTSMKFDPTALLNGDLDGAIKDLIIDGANKAVSGYFAAPPQLTVWHEAGHLYTNSSKFSQYGLAPEDDGTGTPTNGTAAATVRQMHVKMKNLCDQVKENNSGLPHVDYGCIIYGDIDKMANDNDLRGPTNWVPESSSSIPPLDWYGIDVYRSNDGADSDCTHAELASPAAVSQYMDQFHAMVMNRAQVSSPHINVCECNADADANRSQFFWDLATWLHNNDGRRMLTFFHDDPAPHGGPWSSAGADTIATLNEIVASDS
jgi:hypothetical protein